MMAVGSTLTETNFVEIYRRLEKPLFNVVYRWLWNEQESADVVQEAFLRAWRMRERIEPATVDPLIYKIALNLASNRRRARRLWRLFSLDAVDAGGLAAPPTEQSLDRRRREAAVRRAVEALPEGLRHVVLLCAFSSMSYEQVAAILSIPPGTVGSRRNQALKLLRKRLGSEEVSDAD